jgi:sugar (pentulose or hexulose) kinase
MGDGPLYLGFDLSTQQLKGAANPQTSDERSTN